MAAEKRDTLKIMKTVPDMASLRDIARTKSKEDVRARTETVTIATTTANTLIASNGCRAIPVERDTLKIMKTVPDMASLRDIARTKSKEDVRARTETVTIATTTANTLIASNGCRAIPVEPIDARGQSVDDDDDDPDMQQRSEYAKFHAVQRQANT
uniref:Uncharacterized protein n=1 Tax=Oryza rufipogon TaxID=4529 RepID=A0A0E0PY77_ORYRU